MLSRRSDGYGLRRREVVARLLEDRGGLLVVSGLGSPTWDVAAVGDHPGNFPLWGAMGGAAMIGLGLALAQPGRRVLVITGDGEMLMGLGSLATIAVMRPSNLAVVVLDNERYGETGMQPSHTAGATDLAAAARAVGIAEAATLRSEAELEAAIPLIRVAEGPVFQAVKVRAEELAFVLPEKDGVTLKKRFRTAVLGRKTGDRP
ncbi:MAG: thiamine pyrophosphate-dependent enzyme [Kiloniellales bacterium]|nr:thiamine pyrophosphate-dependent enzyme [Kiloniellales bacterium]